MKSFSYSLVSTLITTLLLWIPIIIFKEVFLIENFLHLLYVTVFLFILAFYRYKYIYKKAIEYGVNCYAYNIINTILSIIVNFAMGILCIYLIDLKIFHQCPYTGLSCLGFDLEYVFIGIEYGALSIVTLVGWIIYRFIKFVNAE